MQTDLKGKVVCVSGAARRVGRAIALEFARQGAHLVIYHNASDADAASAAAEAVALGVEALIVKANQSDPDSVARMFDTIRTRYGRLDVMVTVRPASRARHCWRSTSPSGSRCWGSI